MSLRIAPSSAHPTSTTNTSSSKLSSSSSTTNNNNTKDLDRGAPSAPGLPDTLRSSLSPSTSSTTTSSTHPLESRLANWTATQESTRMALLRRNFGIAEPLRRGMELKMVRDADAFRPTVLGAPSRLHEDILTGRDDRISWEDIYNGQDGMKLGLDASGDGSAVGWTEEMERKVGMWKW